MSENRSPRLAMRLVAEFLVIVIGVLVALAVDRWFMALDDRELEATYADGLIADLRADSALLAEMIAGSAAQNRLALELLAVADDPARVVDDTVSFVAGFETVSWSVVPDFNTDTWDDLVSSGNTRLLRDVQVRREVAAYYNRIEQALAFENDWDDQLYAYEERVIGVNPPLRRLEITVRAATGEGSVRDVDYTLDDVRRIRSALENDREITVRLGQVALITRTRERMHARLAEQLNTLLGRLLEHRSLP